VGISGSAMEGDSVLKMPWGIFKGEYIENLPSDYLEWLCFKCEDINVFPIAFAEYLIREQYE
jgi:uncharacterized protein (DUF3820 family)